MKLYHNNKETEVALYTKLTPSLYDTVTPLLQELAETEGAVKSIHQDILEKVFQNEELAQKVDLTKGEQALAEIYSDFRFQEIIKSSYMKVRSNLFEVINVDSTTIPKIIHFVQKVIDQSLVKDAELLNQINSESTSDFWQNQDIDAILEDLKFFRETTCRRIRLL
jgi:hypothetical protein